MSLRAAVSLGSIQTAVSMVVSFASVKITSVYLGPAGLGVLSQMQNVINLALGVVVAGLKNGVVRRTAELSGDEATRRTVVSTTLKLVLAAGLPAAIVVALLSGWIAQEVLHDSDMRIAVLVFAATFACGLVATLMLGCANGARDYRSTTMMNIAASVAGLALFAALCPTFGVFGALVAVAVLPVISFIVATLLSRRSAWWPRRVWAGRFDSGEAARVMAFVPAAAVAAVATPLIHLVLRDALAARSGVASVGLLHGISRLSDLYLGIVTSVFSMYFLPRFAQIKRSAELMHELKRAVALIIPALALFSLSMYLARDWIIAALYTREFAGMRDLFAWQMTGNVLKMVGWLFGYLILAKALPIVITFYESATLLLWWQLGSWLINRNGVIGATQAYAFTYLAYSAIGLCAAVYIVRRMRRGEEVQARSGGH